MKRCSIRSWFLPGECSQDQQDFFQLEPPPLLPFAKGVPEAVKTGEVQFPHDGFALHQSVPLVISVKLRFAGLTRRLRRARPAALGGVFRAQGTGAGRVVLSSVVAVRVRDKGVEKNI